jgi:hypothetical protein
MVSLFGMKYAMEKLIVGLNLLMNSSVMNSNEMNVMKINIDVAMVNVFLKNI